MAQHPWISVIIPVWNRADTIRRCLDSVFAQSFGDYEVLTVDDGSTDASVEIMGGYPDPRLRILRHRTNRGSYVARATAIEAARGRWLVVLGSDDALCPGALEKLNEMTREVSSNVGVVGLSYRYDDGARSPDPPFPGGEIGFGEWLKWLEQTKRLDYLACFRREVFQEVKMPTDGRGGQQVTMRIASRWLVRVDPQQGGTVYTDAANRLTEHKVTLFSVQSRLDHGRMCEEILQEFGPALRQHAPRHYRNLLFIAGRWFLLAGQRRRGAKWMWRHLTSRPWSFRGWVTLVLGLIGPGAILGARRLLGKG